MGKRAAAGTIGRAELRVLDYVQRHGPATVRQVADHFAETEGLVRTTVLNVMVRLWRKRHLTRRAGPGGAAGSGHVYAAIQPRPQLLRSLVGTFVADVLGGSVSPFVAYLADGAEGLSDADREQLAALLRQLERRPKREDK